MGTPLKRLLIVGELLPLALLVIAASTGTPTLNVTRSTGTPGAPLIIHGTGFPPGEVVALYIDQPNPYLYLNPPPGPIADSTGSFTDSLKWPGAFYDPSKHVDPSKPGVHSVCGDTGYPGSTQPIAVKACTDFTVLGATATPPASDGGPSLPLPIIGAGIVVVIILGIAGQWLMTRSSSSSGRR